MTRRSRPGHIASALALPSLVAACGTPAVRVTGMNPRQPTGYAVDRPALHDSPVAFDRPGDISIALRSASDERLPSSLSTSRRTCVSFTGYRARPEESLAIEVEGDRLVSTARLRP